MHYVPSHGSGVSPILWMSSLRLREAKLVEMEHALSTAGALGAKEAVDWFRGTNDNL